MSTLVYRFNSVDDFPVLESYTTVRGSVATRVEGRGNQALLRVIVEPREDEADDAAVVIALPLIAVDGMPERFELTVAGDASGCQVMLEASDAKSVNLAYSFGTVDFASVRDCSADVQRAVEVRYGRHEGGTAKITPPIQLFRLVIRVSTSCQRVALGLVALAVTGEVRLAPAGIA
jgi:hypothetical protein